MRRPLTRSQSSRRATCRSQASGISPTEPNTVPTPPKIVQNSHSVTNPSISACAGSPGSYSTRTFAPTRYNGGVLPTRETNLTSSPVAVRNRTRAW